VKKKLLDAFGKFTIANFSEFTKRNLLMVLLTLFVCLSVSLSAYLGSDVTGIENTWSAAITHAPSTPTPTLAPDTGWWDAVGTPTP